MICIPYLVIFSSLPIMNGTPIFCLSCNAKPIRTDSTMAPVPPSSRNSVSYKTRLNLRHAQENRRKK